MCQWKNCVFWLKIIKKGVFMDIERLNDSNCIYYRGCEAKMKNNAWHIFINGEYYELNTDIIDEVKDFIDSVIDS